MKDKIKNNYVIRLSIFTVAGTILMFTILFLIFYIIAKKQNIKTTIESTLTLLDNMELQIDNHLKSIEQSVDNEAWLIEANKSDETKLKEILRQGLIHNKLAVSGTVAFAPYNVSGKGKYYMLAMVKHENKIEGKKTDFTKYDYFCEDWYIIADALKKNFWSEPFWGQDKYIDCSYSRPLLDKDGNVFAILSANISLNSLAQAIENLEPIKDSYSFI